MANFLDVADVPKIVKTHKFGDINVHGMSVKGLALLIKNHPELFEVFDAKGELKFDMQKIIDLGVDVLSEFLAAGLGYPGDEKAIERAGMMNAEDAWTIGQAIFEESFPGGAANFFAKVSAAMKQAQKFKAESKAPLQVVEEKQKKATS